MYHGKAKTELPARKRIRLPLAEYDWTNVFSITISTFDKYKWFVCYPALADEVVEILRKTAQERGSGLFAWCVMPDHVHLLLRDANVVDFVRLFKGRCTPLARGYERHRRLWQRSFFDHGVRHEESLIDVARYILNNPVESGLVGHAAEYVWSDSETWPDWRQDNWAPAEEITTLSLEESPCSQDTETQDNAQPRIPIER